jgi:hypothetical protein
MPQNKSVSGPQFMHEATVKIKIADAQEHCNTVLDMLEQSGRVPSKEKFRRMACNVRPIIYLCTQDCILTNFLKYIYIYIYKFKTDIYLYRCMPVQ